MAISRLDFEVGGKTGVFGGNRGWLIREMLASANISGVFVSSSPLTISFLLAWMHDG